MASGSCPLDPPELLPIGNSSKDTSHMSLASQSNTHRRLFLSVAREKVLLFRDKHGRNEKKKLQATAGMRVRNLSIGQVLHALNFHTSGAPIARTVVQKTQLHTGQ